MITETAPAKINLFLHVGGLRRDGLHELSSLFVFAEAGDVLTAEPSDELTLEITGPFAAPLRREPVESNLVWRAARALQSATGADKGARLVLDKQLPVAAGIGGGSADAAAALRALVRLWGISIAPDALSRLAFSLGADVPACIDKAPVMVTGAGEKIAQGPVLPPIWTCLVNPGVAMPTGPVFRDFDRAAPHASLQTPRLAGVIDPMRLLASSTNDLQPFAVRREPVIQHVIDRLSSAPGAYGARMSGSGATAFALFSSAEASARAARAARGRGWWATSAAIARRCELA